MIRMARCSGITKKGTQCANSAKRDGFCLIHVPPPPLEHRCVHVGCRRERASFEWCHFHYRKEFFDTWTSIESIVTINIPAYLHGALFLQRQHTFHVAVRVLAKVMTFDEAVQHVIREIIPNNDTDLGRIAKDNQSVHTAAVSKQTNAGLEHVMKLPVPEGQDTILEIREYWGKMYTKRPVQEIIYEDMLTWYTKNTCRTEGDWLYKNVLDRVWAYIKAHRHKREIARRLQQECAESYLMCCDGHISRLINVLVGFDDEMPAPISVGEILQNKMALISAIEDAEERIRQANAVFEELKINAEDARPWLEALA